jgi:hypothetical protein
VRAPAGVGEGAAAQEGAVVGLVVAVVADEAGVLAEGVGVPELDEGVAEGSAGVVVDDGEGQPQREACLVLADVGADVKELATAAGRSSGQHIRLSISSSCRVCRGTGEAE